LYDPGFRRRPARQEEPTVAKKKNKAKKTARKPTRGVRKTSRKAARPKASGAKRGRAKAKAPTKAASKKRAAAPARKAKAAKPAAAKVTRRATRTAASKPEASSGLTPFPPAGEVYGEEGWKEEELSAAEMDVDAPELDEIESDLEDATEAGEESDDSEW
jgi:hypothetical protein